MDNKKKAVAVLGAAGLGALMYFALKSEKVSGEQPAPTPPPTPAPTPTPTPKCTEGEQRCIGYDLYECHNGQWLLKEVNSPACGYTPPTPTPTPPTVFEGAYRCYGGNELQRYENGKWVKVEWNSPLCLGKETSYYAFGRVGEEWIGAYFEKVSAPPVDKLVKITDATMQLMDKNVNFEGSFYVYPDEFRQTGLCYIYFHSDKFYTGTWWKSTKIFNYCVEYLL